MSKILVLGSGGIQIGQAGEFDYSGSQALKALKEEGHETILINPNIATIQTDSKIADKVYFLPLTYKFIVKVIELEKPDGLLLGFGGQTALNCGVQLHEKGILKKHSIKVYGTSIESIQNAEDRVKFKGIIEKVGLKVPKSKKANSVKEALEIAESIGYPVIVRVAYTLGGKGSGVATDKNELKKIATIGLNQSMISQILVEECLHKWKEIEYEVMRDKADNCIIICNMENLDPMGVHTGDSIVVAPSQTLSNNEYHKLRQISIEVIRALEIIGECNIQFALDPHSEDYRIIEVNPRLSRSSALASKATGYPIAYIAAKLALGHTLPKIKNKITGITYSCFEPALDYVVVKIPRWDLEKFEGVSSQIGVQMKSVGEVMAIGRSFEEAFQKGIRMMGKGHEGICDFNENPSKLKILELISNPTDKRIFYIFKALEKGYSIEKLNVITGIDKWFIAKICNLLKIQKEIKANSLTKELLIKAKKAGFSDREIGEYVKSSEAAIRKLRKQMGVVPVVKQIDTLAGEFPTQTNYLYLTYHGTEDDINYKDNQKIVVLGSGVYRIGSSVEFDWCCVNTAWALKNNGVSEVIMINYNPETVSTDFDVLDKLYFEELSVERVLDIWEKENPQGLIASVGGQIPNNISVDLSRNGVSFIGSAPESIDLAENRKKFSEILDKLKIKQPEWNELSSKSEATHFCSKTGYPVIVRPSYVLSGTGMAIVNNKVELEKYLENMSIKKGSKIVVSKFIENAIEIDVDAISDGKKVFIAGILEHIEHGGVHSGDATMVLPSISLKSAVIQKINQYTEKIALALNIKGPFNIQYLVKNNEIFVIECNLRASRSMPFVSKSIGINLMELAVDVFLGKSLKIPLISHSKFGVKSPVFSYFRLTNSLPIQGVEMNSTGEVACFGNTYEEALMLSLISSGFRFPEKEKSILILDSESDEEMQKLSTNLQNKYEITYDVKEDNKLSNNIGLVITTQKNNQKLLKDAVIKEIPVITNEQLAKQVLKILGNFTPTSAGTNTIAT